MSKHLLSKHPAWPATEQTQQQERTFFCTPSARYSGCFVHRVCDEGDGTEDEIHGRDRVRNIPVPCGGEVNDEECE